MSEPTLVSRGISKAFTTGKIRTQVIKDSSLEVWPGELTLIVGPSGSGKSTLLSMLSGLLSPETGHVFALKTDLGTLGVRELERFRLVHCGFVFQGFNLFNALTALENVILPLQYLGVRGPEVERRAQSALDEVGFASGAISGPLNFPAGRSSASRLPGRWSRSLRCCSPTSQPPRWTRPTGKS